MNLDATKLRVRAHTLRVYMAALREALAGLSGDARRLLEFQLLCGNEAADGLDYLADVADETDRALRGTDPGDAA
jgi:hypothetical protein